ncbi:Pectin lyase-like superfamily protein [Striga hermonthica]|uniref:endo-polygalacturonase n=1 Tax=Striga hermonthica TaxID=68872 RepID=A0A9N7N6D1_STRHE|nr:Pectin lyase-like superfamily protein [Striga hermonthica]
MDKLTFIVLFVSLLLAPLESLDRDLPDGLDFLAEQVHDLDVQDRLWDDGFESEPLDCSSHGGKILVNVDSFGAAGDGLSDDTQAFVNAWGVACSASNSVLLVPENRIYLVRATRFKGPCAGKLTIQATFFFFLNGTIVAPDDNKTWDPKNPRTWLGFYNLSKASFEGLGVIDGSGSKWWAASCKRNKSNVKKKSRNIIALTIDSSSAVRVRGLTIRNGQQMNFIISNSNSVRVSGVQVSAPGDSPNTDGIHISASTNVILQNCKIGTGDDCVSIVSGSSGIKMKNIFCGPGHGISIGSLGKDNSTGIVENVVLETAFIRNATNGLRIKTWQGGNGHVTNVKYQNVVMEEVSNPIIIDQFYCDSPKSCQTQTSAVEISNIVYRGITGTSATKRAITFSCSDTVPCTGILLKDVNLQGANGSVETYCHSVYGYKRGLVQPPADCLLPPNDKDTVRLRRNEANDGDEGSHIIHTEL